MDALTKYDLAQALLPRLDGSAKDMLLSLYSAVAFLALRLVAESIFLPIVRSALRRYPTAAPDAKHINGKDKRAEKVFDDAYTSIAAGLLLTWSWHVMLTANGGCTPLHPFTCLKGWPHLPMTQEFKAFWLTMFGYYSYEMIGTAIGKGCVLSKEMIVHHVITMIMMVSYNSRHWQCTTGCYDCPLCPPCSHTCLLICACA